MFTVWYGNVWGYFCLFMDGYVCSYICLGWYVIRYVCGNVMLFGMFFGIFLGILWVLLCAWVICMWGKYVCDMSDCSLGNTNIVHLLNSYGNCGIKWWRQEQENCCTKTILLSVVCLCVCIRDVYCVLFQMKGKRCLKVILTWYQDMVNIGL